jgi:putative nucleotidyltransferase with HDIG domain
MFRRRPAPIVSRTHAALFGLGLAVATLPLVVPFIPVRQALREGDRAPHTLEAAQDAQYESVALTRQAQDEAASRVADVPLPVDPNIRVQQAAALDKLLEAVRTIRQRRELGAQQQLTEVGNIPSAANLSAAGRASLLALDPVAFDALQVSAQKALTELFQRPLPQNEVATRISAYVELPANAPKTAIELTALREILRVFVIPNFQIDTDATERKRADARANVASVVVSYTHGQVIAGEGQELRPPDIEALKATGVISNGFDFYKAVAGALFALALGGLVAAYVYQLQPFSRPPGRRMLLTGATMLVALAGARVALPGLTPDRDQHYFAFALPMAVAAMVAASFAELRFAAVVAVAVGLAATFIGAASPELAGASFVGSLESFELAMAYTAGGLAGALVIYRAERLSRFALSAIAVTIATGAVLVTFWLIGEPRSNTSLGWIALASGINGAASAVLTVGIFVVLSLAFGVTTRLQLMELAHSGHPLLRRLQDEAPGTYHHSQLVGALAERAADRIGADALVVRVGAYYHDIGKLAQPHSYIENMLDGEPNPHDGLPPTVSAAIIREHVLNGLDIARRHHLPAVIRDFIPQHHGTRLVSYFYRRAVQRGDSVDPAPFRYAGPRPQSKETAIVMLADSCEAVVRAREAGERPVIDELVDSIFAERLAEGQLDECDITMRELQEVATSFKATLRALYHPRIAYPEAGPEELARLASS